MTGKALADVVEHAIKAATPAIVDLVTHRVENRLADLIARAVDARLHAYLTEGPIRTVAFEVKEQIEEELRKVVNRG